MITCGLLTLRVSLGGSCVVTVEEERAEEERGAHEENAFESAVFRRKKRVCQLGTHSLITIIASDKSIYYSVNLMHTQQT